MSLFTVLFMVSWTFGYMWNFRFRSSDEGKLDFDGLLGIPE